MLSRIHLIPERNGQTHGQTDGQICYIIIARQYADAHKKLNTFRKRALRKLMILSVVALIYLAV